MNVIPTQGQLFLTHPIALNSLKRARDTEVADNFSIKKTRLNAESRENYFLNQLVTAFENHSYEHFIGLILEHFVKNCNHPIDVGPYKGATPLLFASLLAKKNSDLLPLVQKMAEETPLPDCDATMDHEEYRGMTPLYLAASMGEMNLVALMMEKKPYANYAAGPVGKKACNYALFEMALSAYGNSASNYTSSNWELVYQAMQAYPEIDCLICDTDDEFKNTIFSYAIECKQWPIVEIIIENHPRARDADFCIGSTPFIDYLLKTHASGNTERVAIKFLKRYPHILEKYIASYPSLILFLDNLQAPLESNLKTFWQNLKQCQAAKRSRKALKNKEKFNIRSIAHSFELPGERYYYGSHGTAKKIEFAGGIQAEWQPLMSKVNRLLHKRFPTTINFLLSDHIDLALNPGDVLARIQKKLPTSLFVGFKDHSAHCLFWDQHFILCNRGAASRNPVEVYQYDPSKISYEILKKMFDLRDLEASAYKEYFFNELPRILAFRQGALEKAIEKSCPLAFQTVENCSWACLEAVVWSVVILDEIKKMPGSMAPLKKIVEKANAMFQLWLLSNQVYLLEKFYGLRNFRTPKHQTKEREVTPLALTFQNDKEIAKILFKKLQTQIALLKETFPEHLPIFQNYAHSLALNAVKLKVKSIK